MEDRRAGSRKMIQELLSVRDRLLALYRDLAAQQPFSAKASVDLLEQFCQALIDYTADAHFRLYRYVDEKRERRRAVLEIAESVYAGVLTTTDEILKFNDRYDFSQGRKSLNLTTLDHDLSRLGECLADRIELEDQIIRVLAAEAAQRERWSGSA
jgi:regulator of sigma D